MVTLARRRGKMTVNYMLAQQRQRNKLDKMSILYIGPVILGDIDDQIADSLVPREESTGCAAQLLSLQNPYGGFRCAVTPKTSTGIQKSVHNEHDNAVTNTCNASQMADCSRRKSTSLWEGSPF